MKRNQSTWVSRVLIGIALLGTIPVSIVAQEFGLSQPGSLHLVKEIKPPVLEIVSGSVQFIDPTSNQAIDAEEVCVLTFQVSNMGIGEAIGCTAQIKSTGSTMGVICHSVQLPTIKPNTTHTVEIPIVANTNTTDGRITLSCCVYEPNGFGTDPFEVSLNTRAYVAPYLQVTDYTLTGTASVLEKKKPFDLQILLQNTQYGIAEDVQVTITLPENVFLFGGMEETKIETLQAGETKSLVYSMIANNNYTGSVIPVTIHLKEKFGKYAEDKTIELAFNQTFSSSKIALDEIKKQPATITLATLTSEVDRNIPQNSTTNNNTFAFIIANEHYQNASFAQVPFAINDGKIFSDYCHKTLGLPQENIYLETDVTFAKMMSLLEQLQNTALVNTNSNIIFYYAGHGAPSEATQEAFLIPVDAHQVNPNICFNLQDIYNQFKALTNNRVTVFLDACFSGVNRDNSMIASSRGVAIAPKKNKVEGNLVVFSAASGIETAWPYHAEGHGLFTYFLLKKLQETQGNVDYQTLYQYLYENVRKISNNINRKLQTPTINQSPNLGETWRTWTLK